MRLSSIVSDIIQIINRRHSDLQSLNNDDHQQYATVNGLRFFKDIKIGLDADKPASPVVNDIYWAKDTKKLYMCFSNGVWTEVDVVFPPKPFSQGDILYYDGTKWNILPAGTSGYYLKTQGPNANPVWDAPPVEVVSNYYSPSDEVKHSNDTPKQGYSNTFVLIKEIKITSLEGIAYFRIYFEAYTGSANDYTFEIRRNGTTIYSVNTPGGGWRGFSTDYQGWQVNDLIQLYGKCNIASDYNVRNMQVRFSSLGKHIIKIGQTDLHSSAYLRTTLSQPLPTFQNTVI